MGDADKGSAHIRLRFFVGDAHVTAARPRGEKLTMSTTAIPNVTDRFTTDLIRKTATELVDEGTFPKSELDDVVQDLTLALFEQASNFDVGRGTWSTFVKNVVQRSAISLRRHQGAERRNAQRDVGSLNDLINDEDGQLTELGSTVGEDEYRSGLGQEYRSHTDEVDMALDFQTVIASLPDELREVAQRLQHQSLAEIARDLDIPRTTLAFRIGKIREAFATAGYGD